ncbi:Mitochondrial copper homeostasis protein [Amphichorda felina]
MSSESQDPKGGEGPWDDKTRRKFENKSKSEFYDPCQEAAQRSYKCLFRNNGDRTMCGEYFQCVASVESGLEFGEADKHSSLQGIP